MTTLELTDVSLTYPDGDSRVTALDHVTMTATAGRMTAVVGESGSGKSSLLSVAAGLISPTTGEARVDGVVVTDDVRRERVGMIFQQANLLASLTVRDQLLVTDHIRGSAGAGPPGTGRAGRRAARPGRPGRSRRPTHGPAVRRAAPAR